MSIAEATTHPRREGDADVTQRGTIRKRGTTWTAYWWVEEPRGTVQRSKGGFATKRDAQNYLTKTLAALQTGAFTEPSKVTARLAT